MKMVRVMTSCITLSCISENGPPFSAKPIRLAGTISMYSKNAMPQEKKLQLSTANELICPFVGVSSDHTKKKSSQYCSITVGQLLLILPSSYVSSYFGFTKTAAKLRFFLLTALKINRKLQKSSFAGALNTKKL